MNDHIFIAVGLAPPMILLAGTLLMPTQSPLRSGIFGIGLVLGMVGSVFAAGWLAQEAWATPGHNWPYLTICWTGVLAGGAFTYLYLGKRLYYSQKLIDERINRLEALEQAAGLGQEESRAGYEQ